MSLTETTDRTMRMITRPFPALFALTLLACSTGEAGPDRDRVEGSGDREPAGEVRAPQLEAALAETLSRATALADAIDDTLRPFPLLRPREEAALRRYSNAANLERARRLGQRVADSTDAERLIGQGVLVRLEDSTRHWVVRDLQASLGIVTPDTRVLLETIGDRFHERLSEIGLPAFRFEISSMLRTAADQAALRERNPNAATGESAHEFGTTVDIPYSAYAAPAELPAGLVPDDAPPSLRTALERVARLALERVAARKSRELQAIMGQVLREAQDRGDVLVTLERLQPVYHITVAAPLAER